MTRSATAHLSPDDAAVAMRSFPRRFRALLARPGDDDERVDPDELARRVGPDGRSAIDHVLAADAVVALVDRSIEQARSAADVSLHPAVGDLAGVWVDDPHSPLGDLLDDLEASAVACAERIEAVPTDDWGRPVRVVDADATRSLLDVVRAGVDVTAAHLRSADRTLQAVR